METVLGLGLPGTRRMGRGQHPSGIAMWTASSSLRPRRLELSMPSARQCELKLLNPVVGGRWCAPNIVVSWDQWEYFVTPRDFSNDPQCYAISPVDELTHSAQTSRRRLGYIFYGRGSDFVNIDSCCLNPCASFRLPMIRLGTGAPCCRPFVMIWSLLSG